MVLVSEPETLSLIETLAAKVADLAVGRAVKSKVSTVPPSPPLSLPHSLSSKSKKGRSKASQNISRGACHRCKSSGTPSVSDTWSLDKVSNESYISVPLVKFANEDYVFKLPVLHAKSRHFCNVVNHQTYRVVNEAHLYNGKLTACTCEYIKRMESTIETCVFDDCDPKTISRVFRSVKEVMLPLQSVKRNGIVNSPSFTNEGPRASFNSLLSSLALAETLMQDQNRVIIRTAYMSRQSFFC